ncbi:MULTISPECIES: hypothetical protein [Bacillus]|uniref:Uncharacterized protein n=2 Tax=Bacillus TaxID=1386 RepID=A0A0M5JF14_9BACI|nr:MULTISPECIES: hypothetical protein [Bacillus]ALC82939.1 hypothetical protein AM592_16130 [Bacillus gobiensis]MBP1081930.1 hypothetical protein [Bacillus capparidis]MED1096576.1 hypothetical protein [Bacillus capparidis]
MKQKTLISTVAVSTIGAGVVTSYWLKDKTNRQKVKGLIGRMKSEISKITNKKQLDSFPVDKAGNPDSKDIEDNKMVSEGSMYPVQYYDKKKK